MRCAGCNHILWNHAAPPDGGPRACPECGRPYAIASYQFAPGKVEFCCPSCAQPYFGTSVTGHLEPSTFDCVRCGTHLTEEQCTPRPHGDLDLAEPMLREPLPWLEAGGLASRWWGTTKVAITRGARLPTMLRSEPLLGPAILYLAINAWIAAALGAIFGLAGAVLSVGILGRTGLPAVSGVLPQVVSQAAIFVIAPVFTLAIAWLAACFAAVGTGGFRAHFRRYLEVFCYATGNLVFGLIPFCGGLVAYVLWIVQGAQGVAEAGPRGRSTGPVILAVVGFLVGVVGVGIVNFAIGLLVMGW